MDNLSKTLPIVQQQFDSLLDFAASSKDLNNSVIMSAFRLLYKDVVRLYVAYQEAIINLLERYFKLSRKKTREALEMYKKFLARMDKVASFFQVADAVGLDKSEMPDLTKSPASILNLLEQHLARLEAKKRGTTPQGEDEELDNRENSEQSSASASQQAKEVEQTNELMKEKKEEHSGGETSSEQAKSKEESLKAGKDVLPAQKPPRPSPKTSPLVSPSDSKSPPGSTARQISPSSNVPAAAVPEKKGPPERPAKPPSRPPPPSAAPAPPPPPPPPQQSSGPSGSSGAASSTKVASHASPPPHPPPPQAHHQAPPHPPAPHAPPHPPAPSTSPVPPSTTATSATEANSNNTTSNSNSTNNNNNSADGNKDVSDHIGASSEGPTCSASVVAHNESSVEQPAQIQVDGVVNHENSSSVSHEIETNHINNVSQEAVHEANVEAVALPPPPAPPAEDELEMPPPPPPIDDIDDSMPEPPPPVEAEEGQDPVEGQPQQQADVSQQQPALNGQPTNGAE